MSVEEAAVAIECTQRGQGDDTTIKVGCVGDSITAGVHSSGGNHTYPGQLGIMLETKYPGKYAVTNLGACGSTMLGPGHGNSPYWLRPQFKTLTTNHWDIIIIMLGTNDAKDPGDHGPNNWKHDCGGPDHTSLTGCTFAEDYKKFIGIVQKLGTTPAGPVIYSAIPPPLMELDSIGANQTVINSVYPKLVPLINTANNLPHDPIDIFTAMGGSPDWASKFPKSCTLETAKTYPPCAWWCDAQSCDECHPNNNGYTIMAAAMMKGIGL
jgi:lysophospholipase L1-like esterase